MLFPDRFVDPQDWRILRVLAGYRLLLVLLLAALVLSGYSSLVFDQLDPRKLGALIGVYALLSMVLMTAALQRLPGIETQAHGGYLVDVIIVVTLIHITHRIPGGLGALLVTPTVSCSLVLRTRRALFNVAIGSLVLLGDEAIYQATNGYSAAATTTAGLLGLTLFATAAGASFVAQRARASEAQVARVGSDLATLERLNARIVESMGTAVVVLDEDRRVRRLNAAARQRLDCGPAAEGLPIKLVSAPLARELRRWDANPNLEREPVCLVENSGDGAEVLPRFIRLGAAEWSPVLIQLEDLEAVREQAQQLKLAALGRLSAGIAHEIRNPLSAIRHAAQLLEESPQLADEDRRLLAMIQRHSVRIDSIISDVLGLSRPRRAQPQVLVLRDFLDAALDDFREGATELGAGIEIEAFGEGLRVRFDPDHLRQVLYNLWQNAFDHGKRAGRAVRVQLSAGRLSPGQRPYLDVIDDGQGIPAAVRDKLFEPFFTTANTGTGLGLYLSRELCEYNQARLNNLARESGAQFRIVFTTG